MAKRLLGEDHPQTLATMRHLALLKAREPVDPEAEALIRQATVLTRKRFAKQPARVAACLEDLGTFLLRTGRPTEAEPILLEAYQAAGDGGGSAIVRKRTATQLGALYAKLGRSKDADQWVAEAARIPAN